MNDIIIYGAGGFGREIACMLKIINKEIPQWKFLGFIDDGLKQDKQNKYGKVLGNIDFLNSYPKKAAVAISITSPAIRKKIVQRIKNPDIWFPNLIAPNVNFYDQESLITGHGNIIFFGCRLSCEVKLGDFNILNGFVSLGHDVAVGSFNIFGPSVRISGNTQIGDLNFFGVQSIVLQRCKIGNNTRIGVSSVIMKNTKDDSLYFGNPAKIVKGL